MGTDPHTVLQVGGPGRSGGPIHLDLETRGTDPLDPDAEITTLAIANDKGVWVWDPRNWEQETWDLVAAALTQCKWAAFNALFDGAWLMWKLGVLPPLECCTFLLFRMLANEDWPGQRWRLEIAQSDILDWPDTNKGRLQELMWSNGFSDKGSMWRLADLAPEEYQRYCAEDADASWQLRARLEDLTTGNAGPDVWAATWQMAREEWTAMIQLHIEQQLRGLDFAVDDAKKYYDELQIQIRQTEGKLRAAPILASHIEGWEGAALTAAAAPKMSIKRTRATKAQRDTEVLGDPLWLFGPSVSKSAPAWQQAEGGYWYKEAVEISSPVVTEIPRVNWESDPWLRWLLWGAPPGKTAPPGCGAGGAFAPAVVMAPVERDGNTQMVPHYRGPTGELTLLPLTPSGQMPVGKSVLPLLGEVGALLMEASMLTKRRGYVASYLAAERGGVLHPKLRVHGTSTGRMSGGESREV